LTFCYENCRPRGPLLGRSLEEPTPARNIFSTTGREQDLEDDNGERQERFRETSERPVQRPGVRRAPLG
jgi:hypothetical protein